ncbi:MAG: Zn-ribbon domain-containing OB-fold protein [Methanopyri archaeon]|nr:Zn-ribbon domain-containing OB-fold protein [Methanopyri archaeon]
MSVPRFWRSIENRYRLVGTVCKNCGEKFFPPRVVCPNCRRSGEMEEYEFSGRGEVYSYSVVRVPPEGFEDKAPYVVGIVKLEEGPLVTGMIVDCEPSEVEIGMPVEATFRRVSEEGEDGVIYYSLEFRPVRR